MWTNIVYDCEKVLQNASSARGTQGGVQPSKGKIKCSKGTWDDEAAESAPSLDEVEGNKGTRERLGDKQTHEEHKQQTSLHDMDYLMFHVLPAVCSVVYEFEIAFRVGSVYSSESMWGFVLVFFVFISASIH